MNAFISVQMITILQTECRHYVCKEAAVKPRVSAIQCNIAEILKTQIKMNIV